VDSSFEPKKTPFSAIPHLRESYFLEAEAIAKRLEQEKEIPYIEDVQEIEEMKSFYYIHRAGDRV
jgi:hypothetical protein